jgi:hypothetical protein
MWTMPSFPTTRVVLAACLKTSSSASLTTADRVGDRRRPCPREIESPFQPIERNQCAGTAGSDTRGLPDPPQRERRLALLRTTPTHQARASVNSRPATRLARGHASKDSQRVPFVSQSSGRIRNEVRCQMRNEVPNQIRKEAWNQFETELRNQIRSEVRREARNQFQRRYPRPSLNIVWHQLKTRFLTNCQDNSGTTRNQAQTRNFRAKFT